VEVELSASHTSDPSHLNPSCLACEELRLQLLAVARTAVERVRTNGANTAIFDIYTDLGGIVCPPGDGQRPSASVSIYVSAGMNSTPTDGIDTAVAQLKKELHSLGIPER
jgi:hypothetical protein